MADLNFGAWNASNPYWNAGQGWLPIGDPDNDEASPATYGGVFDGNGHVISNLFIDRGGHTRAGLFDGIAWGAVVRDLGLRNVNVTGNDGVGALAGINNGTVRRAWSTGSVTGNAHNVGGLVGWNGGGDLIENSWSAANVTGGENTGGLVGRSRGQRAGQLRQRDGERRRRNNTGGLVGYNDKHGNDTGRIERSYATGAGVQQRLQHRRAGGPQQRHNL